MYMPADTKNTVRHSANVWKNQLIDDFGIQEKTYMILNDEPC